MREASMMSNAARTVAEAYPGRLLVGIGVSHQPIVEGMLGRSYTDPVGRMRAYLDGMDAARYFGPETEAPPRVLAALGPKMLRLAAERSAGAHPYFVPVEHTAYAREKLGAAPLLAPEVAVALERDPDVARKIAREYAAIYLGLDNYRRNLLRLGYAEDDLAGGGSDKVIDAVIAWGEVDAIRARVRAHLDAGADHVAVQVLGGDRRHLPMAELRELAPALLS
jgi:probable F420-dependent oxidoreductase